MKLRLEHIKALGRVFVTAGKRFLEDRVLKLSAALAYYTIFSIAPLLLITISVISLFLGDAAVENRLVPEIREYVGDKAADQIQDFIAKTQLSGNSVLALTIGIVSLFVGSTMVFAQVQDSLNYIWNIKTVPKRGWLKLILDRLLSFAMIIILALLFTVSFAINGIIMALGDKLKDFIPGMYQISSSLISTLNNLFSFLIVAVIFGCIYKVLPDVKLKWKSVVAGAIFTTLLFILGKYLINIYITQVQPGSTYGAAGSLIIILLWIYYMAIILYFGAEFTQAWAEEFSSGIRPAKYAVRFKRVVEQAEGPEDPGPKGES